VQVAQPVEHAVHVNLSVLSQYPLLQTVQVVAVAWDKQLATAVVTEPAQEPAFKKKPVAHVAHVVALAHVAQLVAVLYAVQVLLAKK